MAFMMPVVKNDWDIYNSRRNENGPQAAAGRRARKVSESRSEGPTLGRGNGTLSPHRSAPAMRSLSYVRAPPSRASLRAAAADSPCKGSASPPARTPPADKFHSRARAESPARGSRCGACMPYL